MIGKAILKPLFNSTFKVTAESLPKEQLLTTTLSMLILAILRVKAMSSVVAENLKSPSYIVKLAAKSSVPSA